MPKWTAADIPDQTGRRVIVTGANSGLGLHTALELARKGASVVLACRDAERGEAALARVLQEVAGADAELRLLDLGDLASVRAFAEATEGPVDVLVNNAGVMALPLRRTADGFESQVGINHLGHFALTGQLLGRLLEAPAPRVVTLSSSAHKIGKIRFDDLNWERRYSRWPAYGQAKLANILFAFELQRRAAGAGTDLVSVAAHPGYAATNLQLAGPRMRGNRIEEQVGILGNRLFAQSDAMGALPQLCAATMDVPGGSYVGPDGPFEARGHPRLGAGASGTARDPEVARRLWEVSETLTGVAYDFTAVRPGAAA